jgi:hypothetical protein
MNTTESRREFEEWLVDYYHESSTMKYDNGDYINVEAVVAWEAWKAAREQITEQRDRLAEALKEPLTTGDNGYGTPTDKAWEMAEQAIAAVKGGINE